MDCTFDLGQLDRLARSLRANSRNADEIAFGLVEGLADVWVDRSRRTVGVDTGQLKARIGVVSIRSTGATAEADLEADTPYAGFHNYGTRYTAPNRFWDDGRAAALVEARRLEGRVGSSIERSLTSGGVWNPRSLF